MNPAAADTGQPRAAPALAADAHKGSAGRLLCVCGSRLMPGAAMLCVRAATRAGAGLVSLAALDLELLALIPLAAPEAVLLDWSAVELGRSPLREQLAAREDHARLAGCGLGQSERTKQILAALLADSFPGPLVLDADALNSLAGEPERLQGRAGFTAITPHPGEASRLLGREVPRDEAGRIEAALELAARSGASVVLKGARSVIASGRSVFVNTTGNPGMATAGSGDVLAGIAVAYLAASAAAERADFTPLDALRAAVHVHGLAGDLAAAELGQRALIASDLIDFLPEAQQRHASCSPPRSC
ncbi:MAG TPA: NAD(P)H-hydrate dehydratase [Planctomycetota bacterium]|nr:NAD(P)H-hydrate dehydratase [Planctomycetota bacterium]